MTCIHGEETDCYICFKTDEFKKGEISAMKKSLEILRKKKELIPNDKTITMAIFRSIEYLLQTEIERLECKK